ncbi:MAG TPA: DUF3127 domain-containing protein [Pirellulaceae bacterium]|nr:DUF3127 domain-containing protein [Pirellulaceae bacterium]HMO92532.1 DUF3127 domain-containing protein [Pirellulaceae bacterium]HMP68985.1 DUF3127 domain-containing protein [Pirellulaceae bacterium]
MSTSTFVGQVHLIEDTKTFGQKGFRKRLVVLEQENGKFSNYVPFEFIQDSCDLVDELHVGDQIEVTYRLSGRKWQKDSQSEVKFFLNAEAIRFKKIDIQASSKAGSADSSMANNAFAEASDDDAPF